MCNWRGSDQSTVGALGVSGLALALFGLERLAFNAVGVRIFGPSFVGVVNTSLSGFTLLAVLGATIPSVLSSKFVAEYLGRDDSARARHIFSAAVFVAVGTTGVVWAVALLCRGVPTNHALLFYAPLFALYLTFRSTYFAFGMAKAYLRAEMISGLCFGVCFGIAWVTRSRTVAVTSVSVQLLAFAMLAVVDHRRHWDFSGAWKEMREGLHGYSGYALATLTNALSGLGSYHLLIVISSHFASSEQLGYLSVLLSALSPLNFVPTAYGAVAMPLMARRHGSRDSVALARFFLRSTLVMQFGAVITTPVLIMNSASVLRWLGVSAQPEFESIWIFLLVSLNLSLASAPSGHFLNATNHIRAHAVLSGAFLVVGVAVGSIALYSVGIQGTGIMRFAVEGALALARVVLVYRMMQWSRSFAAVVFASMIFLASLLAPAVLDKETLWLICYQIAVPVVLAVATLRAWRSQPESAVSMTVA